MPIRANLNFIYLICANIFDMYDQFKLYVQFGLKEPIFWIVLNHLCKQSKMSIHNEFAPILAALCNQI